MGKHRPRKPSIPKSPPPSSKQKKPRPTAGLRERFNALIDDGHLHNLTFSELKVFLACLRHATFRRGYCWPSMPILARESKLKNVTRLREHLEALERKGYLKFISGPGGLHPSITREVCLMTTADPIKHEYKGEGTLSEIEGDTYCNGQFHLVSPEVDTMKTRMKKKTHESPESSFSNGSRSELKTKRTPVYKDDVVRELTDFKIDSARWLVRQPEWGFPFAAALVLQLWVFRIRPPKSKNGRKYNEKAFARWAIKNTGDVRFDDNLGIYVKEDDGLVAEMNESDWRTTLARLKSQVPKKVVKEAKYNEENNQWED